MLELVECRQPRALVRGGIELEAVARADAPVPLRPELGAGAREREVDVEEDGAEHDPRIGLTVTGQALPFSNRGVAQPGSALRSGRRGPQFKSGHPDERGEASASPRRTIAHVARRDEIVRYANELLDVGRWPEFAPPGLQVVGSDEVTLLACGVSSSRDLFEQAVEAGAELVLVHHGLFWRNEPLVVDARLRGRLEALFRGNASLLAYHLALDAHPELGNAAQLASRIGAAPEGTFGGVGLGCTLEPLSIEALAARVRDVTDREPLVLGHG